MTEGQKGERILEEKRRERVGEGEEWRERKAELETVRDGVKIEERMWGKREIKTWESKQEKVEAWDNGGISEGGAD